MENYVEIKAALIGNIIKISSKLNSKIITRNFDFDLEDNLLAGIYAFTDEFYSCYKITYARISSENAISAFLERKDEN